MENHALQTFCTILSCLGSFYLLLVGILVAIDSTVIHHKPNDRITSAVVFIVSGILYGFIFAVLVYTKVQRTKETGSLMRWVDRNNKPITQEIEMK